jgi:hypothetical protein
MARKNRNKVTRYRLRLLRDKEILTEEFFSAPDFHEARLIMRTRLLGFQAAVNYGYPIIHELIAVDDPP